ncbi:MULTISPECIES: SMEK domain-containing protein [Oceanobacillus]|uniref:SMEK domain-containing protein n=1 Tax=Oceanobacillus aidingensis TaxID=645964 RepID=A0ABV9JVV9_9BACI|nr:SMEK domain-containing protein [Oceanobacillus oncorhynchi]MDM8101727.1 SMEK domain-containing protein [Oceanobacillus oncorhynchi]
MNRIENVKLFSEHLVFLNRKVELLGKLNLNDLSVHSENFFYHLFNLLFGLELTNANFEKSNHEAIDLIDKGNKLIIQVSATCTKQKIENTLKKEILKQYSLEDYRIQFIFIGKENPRIKSNELSNPYKVKFDPVKDIYLTKDLVEKFMSLSLSEQSEILKFVRKEIPLLELIEKSDMKVEICDKANLLLKRNFLIWSNFGPYSETAIRNPLSMSVKTAWDERKKEIFKNNDEIVELFHQNSSLFTTSEFKIFIEFEEHVQIFELNHTNRIDRTAYKTFPQSFSKMITNIILENGDSDGE